MSKIVIASDHGGFSLKEEIKKILNVLGVSYEDLGTNSTDSVDYPDYAELVAQAVQHGSKGILCCGTGIGMSIAANKFKGVRAALCTDVYMAQMSREHNDANILILGGRVMKDSKEVPSIVKVWLETSYQGGRHQNRLNRIKQFEENKSSGNS